MLSTSFLQRSVVRLMSSRTFPIKDEFKLKLLSMDGGSVDLHKDNTTGIATILMNNPEKRNAISGEMMVDLEKCVTELESWNEGKGVVLAGVGGTFCSGGDLDTVQGLLQGTDGSSMAEFMHNVTSRLHNLPMLSLAAIDGHALGGGAELTTACDFRIMTEKSKIGFVHIKLNIVPAFGGCTRLVNILGWDKALHLLTSGRIMDSQYAMNINYVSEIVPDTHDVAEQGVKWLEENCSGDAGTVRVMKTMVMAATELNPNESLDRERQLFSMVWGSELHRNAMTKIIKHK